MANFAFELRTEEIPANALAGARRQLVDGVRRALEEVGFADPAVRVLSTSRRLVVIVDGLPERQADRTERMTGPPVGVAYADDGSPTKAAEGFAKKVGIALEDLETDLTDKGEYLTATVVHAGRPTTEILSEIVPGVVAAMRFPKMMRWGHGDYEFVRPVHGLVALLDGETVRMEAFGVASGRTTVGHRVHDPDAFEIDTADDLVGNLARRAVLADPAERPSAREPRARRCRAGRGPGGPDRFPRSRFARGLPRPKRRRTLRRSSARHGRLVPRSRALPGLARRST